MIRPATMLRLWIFPPLILGLGLSLTVGLPNTESLAQTDAADSQQQDEIPPAALLTDRGTQLVERLKQLRRTESRMGTKHPTLPEIREQIEEIKQQLKAWEPAPNPFRRSADQEGAEQKPIPLMNEEDLRQVVLALTEEVTALRQRVDALERQVPATNR